MLLLVLLAGGALAAPAQDAPAAGGPPYRVGDGVTRPEKISGGAPVYTELARRARVTGTVIVEAIIDEQGDVVNTRILKGLPMGLDRAAEEAAKTWKFTPAMKEGKPVKVYYVLTVNFQVGDSPPLGPQLQKFLQGNPEFAQFLKAKRYTEAAALLDRPAAERSAEPELTTARCYLLLSQGRLDDAWEVAQSYRGPDPYEMLALIGGFAQARASYDKVLSPEGRAAVIDLGLQAATMALETRQEGLDAMISKALLLREKAKLTGDPALADEATRLQQQASELQDRLRDAAGPKQ
ncbi:MAG TPA: energy transducer TonB [Thermoanaerobaculia bacterium]|nr:energy transducer TonB [Thermoanaerobaculia bacterium]